MSEMPCRELVEAITAYLDGALGEDDRRRFDAHLAQCDGCAEYLSQVRETIALTGTLDEPPLSQETRERLVAAFREWRALSAP
jgi:anti-sigma factor RsiW